MAIQLAVFAFGGLLMLVAILGGGFEVKELKVPKVGRSSRLAACVCGMLFAFLGIRLDRPAVAQPPAVAPQSYKSPEAAPAALPQIILVSGSAGQLEMRMAKVAEGPDHPSPHAASPAAFRQLRPSNPAPQPSRVSNVESKQEERETASEAVPRQVRPSKAEKGDDDQAAAASGETGKRGPIKKIRQWWRNRKADRSQGDGR